MQAFHYNYIKNKYSDKAETLLTDNDSLMYKIEAENVHENFHKDKESLDFSNYQKDSRYYNNENNLVVSKMKDETLACLYSFVRLKFKMYTFITEGNQESKKEKTLIKKFVDDELRYKHYKNLLFNRSYMRHEMNRVQSKDQNIVSYRINKTSLSSYDDYT